MPKERSAKSFPALDLPSQRRGDADARARPPAATPTELTALVASRSSVVGHDLDMAAPFTEVPLAHVDLNAYLNE